MTFGFASITVAAMLIYTSFKNMTVADLLLNRPGPGQPGDIVPAGSDGSTLSDFGPPLAGGLGMSSKSGVASWNGKQVAAWMIPWLKKAKAAGWDGCITSGYRTPEYSEQLCMNMCGAPSCPGKCAGKSSNHSGKKYPDGAIDVCNPENFKAAASKVKGFPLKNDLPADLVHFSVSGH